MEKSNKSLWVIVGIALGLVIAMLGMLIYNKYVDKQEDTNNKTEEKVPANKDDNNDNGYTENDIDLTGYTELDIGKQNIYPIYERYEKNSFIFNLPNNLSYEGKFIIENSNLYFNINNKNYLLNVNNPKKVLIGSFGMGNSFILMVLTKEGIIYSIDLNPNYDGNDTNTNADIVINEFVSETNKNIDRYSDINDVDNISAILTRGGAEWEDLYFTYTKDGKEMITRVDFSDDPVQEISSLKVNLGPVKVKSDKSVFDNKGNKLDIKAKYLIEYISETGHGAFLDEDNYLYVSTYKENENMKKGKVKKVYKTNNAYDDILVIFEDGSSKKLSDYYEW